VSKNGSLKFLLLCVVGMIGFALIGLVCSCVVVNTPDGGTALVPGVSSDTASAVKDSGLLDFLPLWAKIPLLLMTGSTALSLGSKNGRKVGSVVADPQSGVIESLHGLGHLATFGIIPPPASAGTVSKE
jgi:hypothetical protein